MNSLLLFFALALVLMMDSNCRSEQPATRARSWEARNEIIEAGLARGQGIIYRESDVPAYQLPDPLRCSDGTVVTDQAGWENRRRHETLELFRTHVYGRSPQPSNVSFNVSRDEPVFKGKAIFRRVKIRSEVQDKAIEFVTAVIIPNKRPGPVPTILLITHRSWEGPEPDLKDFSEFYPAEQLIDRGFAVVLYHAQQISPDDKIDPPVTGARAILPSPGKVGEDAWGTIAAWAWGASRVIDFLVTNKELDPGKVTVLGHSRGGKTALWAGAEDQRIALVISNNSGCTGAALARRAYGETIRTINKQFPHWFCGNYKKYNNRESELPIDQHQLPALIAPRALYVASADEDLWADPRGEFLSLVHASPVYSLFTKETFKNESMPPLDEPIVRGKCGYHIRQGKHQLSEYDWNQYVNFATQLRK